MARRAGFVLRFAPEALDHVDYINLKYHRLVRRVIGEQLGHAPEVMTRNRKPLEQPAPFGAGWELRFGPGNRFRVFYEVDATRHTVYVLAIGVKDRDRLIVGGEEFQS
ncbi:MAG: type II toxin-antitoxin system RelE family toxin [Armatimonadota bacterium]